MEKKDINMKFYDLIIEGKLYLENFPAIYSTTKIIKPNKFYKWAMSSISLVGFITGKKGIYWKHIQQISKNFKVEENYSHSQLLQILGVLESIYNDWKDGFLQNYEYVITAANFEDFLEYAANLHKGGKKIEAAVLVSIVFEDLVKKIAKRHGLDHKKTIYPIIEDMFSHKILNDIQTNHFKAIAGFRNKALHANWDEFDIKDVGKAIKDVMEIIKEYLS
jgi:hypothetical protein